MSELLQPIRPKSALSSVKNELTRVKQKAAVELPLSKEEAKRVSGPLDALCYSLMPTDSCSSPQPSAHLLPFPPICRS